MHGRLYFRSVIILTLSLILSLSSTSSSAQNPPQILSGITERVSVASDGSQANNASGWPSISADGRYTAFSSYATNLVSGDTNFSSDIFVHDQNTGETIRVSVASDGMQGSDDSWQSSISADGRYVAFESEASNLVLGDTNLYQDIFVHDRQTGETARVSISSEGAQANAASWFPSISSDGRYVAFTSLATNLVVGDTNLYQDIFVHDRQTGETARVSISSEGAQANAGSDFPLITADGHFVAFDSVASNLVIGDTNNAMDTFVHDRQTGETRRVSVASDGTQGNGSSVWWPSISADGRYVSFASDSTNLVDGDTNYCLDAFLHDLETGETIRVSVASDGMQGWGDSWQPSISSDGRYVAFSSLAANLVVGDTNLYQDIFVHDQNTGETIRVSVASDGSQGNSISEIPSISANGRYVAFWSNASNLVSGDTNGNQDAFVHDRGGGGIGYSISGNITNLFGSPLDGVTVSAGAGYNAITDASGNYSINNVITGTYTIIPSLVGYSFSPPSLPVSVPPNAVDQDFIGSAFNIERFEVNQVLGEQKNGEQNYVAGKATALRVFLNVPINTDPSNQKIIVKRNGVLLTELYPKLQPGKTDVLEFLCPTMWQCNFWQAGTYTFEVSVNGIFNQYGTYEFVERKELRILAVPVRIRNPMDPFQELEPDDSWKNADELLVKTYPISLYGVDWDEAPMMDATDLILLLESGCDKLWDRLRKLQPPSCGLPGFSACYDQIIGFIPPVPVFKLGVEGWTNGAKTSVVMTRNYVDMIVAHEVGHNVENIFGYGLGDEYAGGNFNCAVNPAPENYHDKNGNRCIGSQAIPWEDKMGSKVVGIGENQDYPYDFSGEIKHGDLLSFMGGSGLDLSNYWITPDVYSHLFYNMAPASQVISTHSVTETIIQASGWIGLDGTMQLDPWISLPATAPPPITGTYTIEALDAADQVLASQGFEVSF